MQIMKISHLAMLVQFSAAEAGDPLNILNGVWKLFALFMVMMVVLALRKLIKTSLFDVWKVSPSQSADEYSNHEFLKTSLSLWFLLLRYFAALNEQVLLFRWWLLETFHKLVWSIYRNSVILLQISLKLVVTLADWLSVLDDLQLKRMIQRGRLRWRCWWWWRNI